jgi:ribose transport system permease protein
MINTLKRSWSRFGLLLVLMAFLAFFIWRAEGFLTEYNLFTLVRFASVQVMIAFAQMLALSAGEMNLSIGAIGGMVAMFAGAMMEIFGVPPLIAIAASLALAVILGLINGFLVTRTGISSFIITLATSSIFTGIMLIVTKADSFDSLPKSFLTFSRQRTLGLALSPLFWIMVLIAITLWLVYNRTALGREILAVGANRRAAQMSGLNQRTILMKTHVLSALLAGVAGIMTAHVLSALLAGVAGIMTAAMLADAVPIIGSEWLMGSFAANAVGGTAITGGAVSVFGTVLGGFLIAIIYNGVLLLNVSNFFVNFFLGLVLLLAVYLDRLRKVYAERTSLP